MCFILTIAVAAKYAAALKTRVPRHLHLARQANPDILRQLPANVETVTLTTQGCSCSLYMEPNEAEEPEDPRDELGRRRRRYERKGWSESKIERAVSAASAHQLTEGPPGLREDVRELVGAAAEETGELHLLVHNYSGGVNDEPVPRRLRRSTITVSDVRAGLTPIAVDFLYVVKPGRPAAQRPPSH